MTTNKLNGRLMPIGTVDNRYNACRYSPVGSPEGAALSSQSCDEDHSDEGTLLVRAVCLLVYLYDCCVFSAPFVQIKLMMMLMMMPTSLRYNHN